MPRKTNTVLNAQAREMLYAVYKYFLKQYETDPTISISWVCRNTAQATNTSASTVRRIAKEASDAENAQKPVVFKTPGAKRNYKSRITGISDIEQKIIRKCIRNFHHMNMGMITILKLHKLLQNEINFQGSECSLRRILKRMGFVWKKTKNNGRFLVEKSKKSNMCQEPLNDEDDDDYDDEIEDLCEDHQKPLNVYNRDDHDDDDDEDLCEDHQETLTVYNNDDEDLYEEQQETLEVHNNDDIYEQDEEEHAIYLKIECDEEEI